MTSPKPVNYVNGCSVKGVVFVPNDASGDVESRGAGYSSHIVNGRNFKTMMGLKWTYPDQKTGLASVDRSFCWGNVPSRLD
ncbi:hypothetical protein FHS27_003864 [Rhodopirellula rubra]|uniref:Uncharacterized protein n=1 Tax=Aporhodopirellula rubra TaxID=980271 RepID=A0A7W5E2E1_9BACT|nr:hypothetical protein [Aporhodopirellula rubra]